MPQSLRGSFALFPERVNSRRIDRTARAVQVSTPVRDFDVAVQRKGNQRRAEANVSRAGYPAFPVTIVVTPEPTKTNACSSLRSSSVLRCQVTPATVDVPSWLIRPSLSLWNCFPVTLDCSRPTYFFSFVTTPRCHVLELSGVLDRAYRLLLGPPGDDHQERDHDEAGQQRPDHVGQRARLGPVLAVLLTVSDRLGPRASPLPRLRRRFRVQLDRFRVLRRRPCALVGSALTCGTHVDSVSRVPTRPNTAVGRWLRSGD